MLRDGVHRVIIIGGGATGVLLASHLLCDLSRRIEIIIVEKSSATGLGLAYGTVNPRHLLNVRASNMSAFPDRPSHFWDWVTANDLHETFGCSDAFCFVPRAIYGRYLASLLSAYLTHASAAAQLQIVRGECVALHATRQGVEARLADGTKLTGDTAVLATGNEAQVAAAAPYNVTPWTEPAQAGVSPDDAVLILGSGLTMIDYVVSLLNARHRAPILALSRRGLLPHVHRQCDSIGFARSEVPFGAAVSQVLQWLRRTAERAEARGQNWRSVIDGLRPYIQEIWQCWPLDAKRRFLRHARAWWDVHRHRTAPDIERQIEVAIADGQLKIVAGKVRTIADDPSGATVSYTRRGAHDVETAQVAKIVRCTGVSVNLRDSVNPVLRHLLAAGLVRPDPLGIGIDVTADNAAIDRNGRPSQQIFAIGPLTRGKFWEIVAIPDIRMQCASLAERIAGSSSLAAE
jgi:uncharacterized NAD(P)/FAD-binding protein YdhS